MTDLTTPLARGVYNRPIQALPDRVYYEEHCRPSEATKDYVFFLPYLPLAVFPELAIDPVAIMAGDLKQTVPVMCWTAPYQLIPNLRSLRERGIGTAQLFAVPRQYGRRLAETAQAISLMNPATKRNAFIRPQVIRLLDWSAKLSRPIASLQEISFPVYVWGLGLSGGVFHVVPLGSREPPAQLLAATDRQQPSAELDAIMRRVLDLDQTLVKDLDTNAQEEKEKK